MRLAIEFTFVKLSGLYSQLGLMENCRMLSQIFERSKISTAKQIKF